MYPMHGFPVKRTPPGETADRVATNEQGVLVDGEYRAKSKFTLFHVKQWPFETFGDLWLMDPRGRPHHAKNITSGLQDPYTI